MRLITGYMKSTPIIASQAECCEATLEIRRVKLTKLTLSRLDDLLWSLIFELAVGRRIFWKKFVPYLVQVQGLLWIGDKNNTFFSTKFKQVTIWTWNVWFSLLPSRNWTLLSHRHLKTYYKWWISTIKETVKFSLTDPSIRQQGRVDLVSIFQSTTWISLLKYTTIFQPVILCLYKSTSYHHHQTNAHWTLPLPRTSLSAAR